MNDLKIKELAKKWYKILNFPEEYNEKFDELLNSVTGLSEISIFDFDLVANKENFKENAVMALYFCEETSKIFEKRGIPYNVLTDTLWDIKWRIMKYTNRVGEMGLDKLCDWLYLHLRGENIQLGRLQFQIRKALHNIPEHSITPDTPTLAVHIPSGAKLTAAAALESFCLADEFFPKYFPEHEYQIFTCSSWLLDKTLKEFLPDGSGILEFASLFEIIEYDKSFDAFIFAFPYGTTKDNVKDFIPTTSLQRKIKDHVLAGGELYAGYGIRKSAKIIR